MCQLSCPTLYLCMFQWVINNVDSQLHSAANEVFSSLKQTLWTSIDEEILLRDCDVYSYNPDLTSDPFGEEGCTWSFNYFFYNKKLKRIVFFTCRATRYIPICLTWIFYFPFFWRVLKGLKVLLHSFSVYFYVLLGYQCHHYCPIEIYKVVLFSCSLLAVVNNLFFFAILKMNNHSITATQLFL